MATFGDARETWNARYACDDYLFGEAPNAFVERSAPRWLRQGDSALCVADGEGRNSVWLAGRGVRVVAFDVSDVAVAKAHRLAASRGVSVDSRVCDLAAFPFESTQVDAVVAVFIQFRGPDERGAAFARMMASVRPGGCFLLEGYRPEQIAYRSGGPGAVENYYTRAWVERTFAGWELCLLAEYDAVLSEGRQHTGRSALIDVVARRPGGTGVAGARLG